MGARKVVAGTTTVVDGDLVSIEAKRGVRLFGGRALEAGERAAVPRADALACIGSGRAIAVGKDAASFAVVSTIEWRNDDETPKSRRGA